MVASIQLVPTTGTAMKGRDIVFSSARTGGKDTWRTPPALFDALHAEFHFTVDGAADPTNHLCSRWWGPGGEHEDALDVEWPEHERVFCNPPYSWVTEFVQHAAQSPATSALLLPARTDTRWFHTWVYPYAEIRFLKGRVKFVNPEGAPGVSQHSAPFPSMIVVFR
jgi:phage N-6-adenine-methyltransferase